LNQFFKYLHDGEHAGFGAKIIAQLKAVLATVTLIGPLWDAYEALVQHETLLFKLSQASPETQEIAETDKARDGVFQEVRHRLLFYANSTDPTVKAAAMALLFVLKPYEGAAKRELFEETTFIVNLLADFSKPVNAQYIAAVPSLAELIAELASLNEHLDILYTQRLRALEDLKQLGKRADIRKDVDHAFNDLLEAMNSTHHYLLLSNSEPAVRATLEEAALFINALVDQLHKILAHRGHRKAKEEDKTDEGTQTPDTTPPAPPPPPESGTQNPSNELPKGPDTTQNPSDEPHHLDPNEHPAAGE
jgi:hypothetical protein